MAGIRPAIAWAPLGLALALAASSAASAGPVDPRPIRALLLQGDHAALEKVLHDAGRHGDGPGLHGAYQAFRSLTPEQTSALDAWVADAPNSDAAALALAHRELGYGWARLGRRNPATLGARRRNAIAAHARRAVELGEVVRARDPGRVEASLVLLEAARLLGDATLAERAWAHGFALAPANEALWNALLDGLTRRSGGSYAELEQAAESAQPQAGSNPRLVLLRARADADRARDLRQAEDHASAIRHLDRALGHGEQAWLLGERAWTHHHAGDAGQALRDIDRAIELAPFTADHHHRRAHLLLASGRHGEAEEAASLSVDLAPANDHYGWVLESARAAKRQAGRTDRPDPSTPAGLLAGIATWLREHVLVASLLVVALALVRRATRHRQFPRTPQPR